MPGALSTAICSGLPTLYLQAMLARWAPSHARRFTGHRSGRQQSGQRKRAGKPTSLRVRRGISACWPSRDRRSHRRHSVTPSMPVTSILKSDVSVATPIRPSPSKSCGDRNRLFMSWSATCGARIGGARLSQQTEPSGCAADGNRKQLRVGQLAPSVDSAGQSPARAFRPADVRFFG